MENDGNLDNNLDLSHANDGEGGNPDARGTTGNVYFSLCVHNMLNLGQWIGNTSIP